MPALAGEAGCGSRRRSRHYQIDSRDGWAVRLSGPAAGMQHRRGLTRGVLRCLPSDSVHAVAAGLAPRRRTPYRVSLRVAAGHGGWRQGRVRAV